MLIALDWLADYVDISGLSGQDLTDRITMFGIESKYLGRTLANDQLVVGHVVEVEKHPNADKLTVCQVDTGNGEPSQIVCGAPNVAAGQKVVVALLGAKLANGMEIGKAKIRKFESFGMICAEDEIGLGDDHEGIIVLPDDAEIGTPFLRVMHMDGEQIETDVTPNRPDTLSHIGTARDVAAMLGNPLKMPEISLVEDGPDVNELASVEIDDPVGCPRYAARVIQNVKIGPSPDWLTGRLRQVGLRPINNIVDITNYVLMSIGHPLHAFDLDTLAGRKIAVRAANDGEKFTTLDQVERDIPPNSVLICDGEKPVALGGVMGGMNSEISEGTTNVLLESAYFDPSRIRRTAKKVGLQTDASYRFERGTDYEGLIGALDWAAMLMQQLAGGTVARGRIDVYPTKIVRAPIHLRYAQVPRILGVDVTPSEIAEYLTALDIEIVSKDDEGIDCVAPPWRPDLEREIDLIEEVTRSYGYERIPAEPRGAGVPMDDLTPEQVLEPKLHTWLIGLGLHEAITPTLVPESYTQMVPTDGEAVALANFSTADMSHMRTHMLPNLLQVAKHNFSHRSENGIAFFEVGFTYHKAGEGKYEQVRTASIMLTGEVGDGLWGDVRREWDFYDLKGMFETLIGRCSDRTPDVLHYDSDAFAPDQGVKVTLDDGEVGQFGLVKKDLAERFDLMSPVFYGQVYVAALAAGIRKETRVVPLPRYPAIELDLAFVVPVTTPARKVDEIVWKNGGRLLESVSLFDVYRGVGIPDDEKSLGFKLRFRHEERTLTDKDVEKTVKKIISTTERELGARIRA
jgi:phenylalanyl-tRNA synthetase beta chain